MIGRRRFLEVLAALGVSQALPTCATDRKVSFDSYPFTLGVASGYPSPSGVVLWTRLMGLEPLEIPVRWEVAADEAMRQVIFSGETTADPAWAHSARVEVQGLEPDRWYWYRFTAGDARSPIGRTRTAPAAAAPAQRLRFAFASCQQYEQGFFGAYRHIVADQPDLVAFLGDYIYESSWGSDLVRSHDAPEPYSLADYRARHALYRSDPDLQAAHAACPWIVTWDDHEVDNDYANDRPEDGMGREEFLRRRAAAYRAYYEHLPLPPRMRPEGPNMRIYTHVDWGTLARFFVLDDRQYRSWHACPRPGWRGGSNTVDVSECTRLASPARSILGRAQERWLDGRLAASRAQWNVIAQQTRMAQMDELPGPGRRAWTDSWDGYPAARQRLLDSIAARKIQNPVVIGGDIHAFNVCQLKADFADPRSAVVASEFVGTSITSQGWPQERINEYLPDNPHVLYADSRYRGYVRVELDAKLWKADLRAMQTVQRRDAPCFTLASFVVEDGKAGPLKV
ncbi:MAG: alkaline phosphatase [Betaproteobacteria bacterium]|nr:MAG: alkaline phosphatase [Betaproteobacteria bacterium]TMI10690.1 MAG: alkaline phosphatase [Betaproteobacteria bacterium]